VHDPAAYEPADCEIDKAARPEPSLPVARSTTDVPVATRDTTPVGNRDQPVTTSCAVPHVAPLSVDRVTVTLFDATMAAHRYPLAERHRAMGDWSVFAGVSGTTASVTSAAYADAALYDENRDCVGCPRSTPNQPPSYTTVGREPVRESTTVPADGDARFVNRR